MDTTDRPATLAAEDHCLVHHFIRTYGRRPSPAEMAALRQLAVTAPPARRHAAAPNSMVRTVRREVARLINRLGAGVA